jgi:hypothetical protein
MHEYSDRADACTAVPALQYHELDTVEVAIPALNRLLKSPEFWGELSAAGVTRTLFFQTDSLLVHGGIQPFMQVGSFSKREEEELPGVVCFWGSQPAAANCTSFAWPSALALTAPPHLPYRVQYDYVGAPWHTKNERWGPARKRMPNGVGNGGLSLRSVPAMQALSAAYANASGAQQEDFFYSTLLENATAAGGFQLAPRQRAYAFCAEVPCDDLEAGMAKGLPGALLHTLPQPPMALHATW